LGTPDEIALSYNAPPVGEPQYTEPQNFVGEQQCAKPQGVTAGKIFASIGVVFFNLCIGYPILISLAASIFSIIISGVALVIGSVGIIILSFTDQFISFPFIVSSISFAETVLYSISFIGIGCLLVIGSVALWNVFWKGVKPYLILTWNITILKGVNKNV